MSLPLSMDCVGIPISFEMSEKGESNFGGRG